MSTSQTVATVIAETWNKPILKQLPSPQVPTDGSYVRIKPLAVAVHQIVRFRVTGTNYSAQTLPHPVGIDGVGLIDDSDKTRVYFTTLPVGGGGFSEEVVVPKKATWPLPEGADEVQVAALMNPAMASFMALKTRWAARGQYPDGFKILILGATSASGRVAAGMARLLGAKTVLGAARSAAKIATPELFDDALSYDQWPKDKLADVDVVLDFVWGSTAPSLMAALPSLYPITWINVGTMGGDQASIHVGSAFRGKNITLVGSGPGAWHPQKDLAVHTGPMLDALVKSGVTVKVRTEPLANFEKAWNEPGEEGTRLVFKP